MNGTKTIHDIRQLQALRDMAAQQPAITATLERLVAEVAALTVKVDALIEAAPSTKSGHSETETPKRPPRGQA